MQRARYSKRNWHAAARQPQDNDVVVVRVLLEHLSELASSVDAVVIEHAARLQGTTMVQARA
jgi:hypothetical protein